MKLAAAHQENALAVELQTINVVLLVELHGVANKLRNVDPQANVSHLLQNALMEALNALKGLLVVVQEVANAVAAHHLNVAAK